MDFLEKYYSSTFIHDVDKLKESASKIPNKELAESVLQAIDKNKEIDTKELIERVFDIQNIMSQEGKYLGKEVVLEMLDAMTKIPFEVYERFFEERGGLLIGHLVKWCRDGGIKLHPQVLSSLEDAKDFGRGCPRFFNHYKKYNDCKIGNENCNDCWTSFFKAMCEERCNMVAKANL